MQRISQSLTGNHALSWLLKMPSLSTNQRSVILPFIDKTSNRETANEITLLFVSKQGCKSVLV